MNNFWNKVFGRNSEIDESLRYKYNQYHHKNGDENIFVCQKFVDNPNWNDDNPYHAKVIAVFRNIKPKIGINDVSFVSGTVVLYDKFEMGRYTEILNKRVYD